MKGTKKSAGKPMGGSSGADRKTIGMAGPKSGSVKGGKGK